MSTENMASTIIGRLNPKKASQLISSSFFFIGAYLFIFTIITVSKAMDSALIKPTTLSAESISLYMINLLLSLVSFIAIVQLIRLSFMVKEFWSSLGLMLIPSILLLTISLLTEVPSNTKIMYQGFYIIVLLRLFVKSKRAIQKSGSQTNFFGKILEKKKLIQKQIQLAT